MLKKIIKKLLPENIIYKLSYIKNNYFGEFALKSYSQEGEDMILRRIFEGQKTGFYVDVGAHHPKRFSNTYYFYKLGWRGINIDAMPGSMKLFKKIRPRDINLEKAISDKKEVLTYYVFNEPALNGFSPELSWERHGRGNYFIKYTINIETVTLEEVLDEYLPKGQEIDFLSIDVEGFDYKVLRSNNFEKYRPKVILVEIPKINLSDIESNEIVRFLKNHNYVFFAKTFNTAFFIAAEFYDKLFKQG